MLGVLVAACVLSLAHASYLVVRLLFAQLCVVLCTLSFDVASDCDVLRCFAPL